LDKTASWLRSNVVGLIALFVALSGVAYAATAPRDSVVSRSIKDGQVKLADVGTNAVDGTRVVNDSLDGNDIDQLNTGIGGDLTGNLSVATIKPNAVDTDEIADGSLAPADHGAMPAVRAHAPPFSGDCETAIPGDGTLTPIRFFSEEFDTASMHSGTCLSPAESTKAIAPIDGIYAVSANVVWNANTTGTRFLGIRRNGTDDDFVAASRIPATADTPENAVTTLISLDQGQFVEAVASQNSGTEIEVGNPVARNHLAMHWVAPQAP
jgi:hypothetical protein